MKIGYSVPTILLEIIKKSKVLVNEARIIEYQCHCEQNQEQVEKLEDTLIVIEDCLEGIKEWIGYLKERDM